MVRNHNSLLQFVKVGSFRLHYVDKQIVFNIYICIYVKDLQIRVSY